MSDSVDSLTACIVSPYTRETDQRKKLKMRGMKYYGTEFTVIVVSYSLS